MPEHHEKPILLVCAENLLPMTIDTDHNFYQSHPFTVVTLPIEEEDLRRGIIPAEINITAFNDEIFNPFIPISIDREMDYERDVTEGYSVDEAWEALRNTEPIG